MDKQTLIDRLNRDLAGEYQAILQYMQHYFVMKGPERLTVGEFFKKVAIGEMKHAEFLAEKIVALGGIPTVTPLPVVQPATVREMLEANLAAERQAIRDYAERAEQAEAFGDEGLETELENILAEETAHAEAFAKLLPAYAPATSPQRRGRKPGQTVGRRGRKPGQTVGRRGRKPRQAARQTATKEE